MELQRQEFRIGIMVLTAIVCLTLMTVFFGRQPVMRFNEDNLILVRFQRLTGINRSSPVLKNGVQIGRVVKVELVDQDREVEVSIALDKGRKVYTNEECRLHQSMIMGNASLIFVKRSNFVGQAEEIDRAVPLVGAGSSDIMSGFGNLEGDLTKVIQNVSKTAEEIGAFVNRINSAIGTPEEFAARKETFDTVVNEARQTMNSVRQTTDGISQVVNDPAIQNDVRQVIAALPDVIERSKEVIERSQVLVGESTLFVQETRSLVEKGTISLDNLSAGLDRVYQTLESVTKIADQIEGDVPEIVSAVKRSAFRLESLFSELTLIVENFRKADGTVKRLIRDPEAYEKLLATLKNVEQITDEVDRLLQVDAKPIAHNVKILTDKAARDPSIFIRNLLRKEPPIKPQSCWVHGLGNFGFGRGMYGTQYLPEAVVEEEVIEVIQEEAIPVQYEPVYYEPVRYVPSESLPDEGRIVNVDPRYSGY